MKKVANEKNYKWKGLKDYEKIHKWKIYSFSERMLGRAIRNWNQNLPRGRLLLRKIFRIWANDYDDRWNRIGIYICEVIHKCKFFFAFICDFFHSWKFFHLWKSSLWKRLQVEPHEYLWVRWNFLGTLWKLSQKDRNTKLVSVFISKKFSICVTICEIFHNVSAFISDFFHKQFFLQNIWTTAHVRIYICDFFTNEKNSFVKFFTKNIWIYVHIFT